MFLSVIIPVKNEAESLPALHREIVDALKVFEGQQTEIIYVDDGSTDNTAPVLASLAHATVIRFRRNFGQTAAMQAGINESSGQVIVFLDGDGQNDPADIPMLVSELTSRGLEMVCGWRTSRRDSFGKRFISRGAFRLRQFLLHDQIHDSGCTLKAIRREVLETIPLYGELHRLIPALAVMNGFSVDEVAVNHRPRVHGSTKYNWHRTVKGFVDMFGLWFWKRFEMRPMHFFGALGFLAIGLGGLTAGLATVFYVQGIVFLKHSLPVLAAVEILGGAQLLSVGLLADRLFSLRYDLSAAPRYAIVSRSTSDGLQR